MMYQVCSDLIPLFYEDARKLTNLLKMVVLFERRVKRSLEYLRFADMDMELDE